jgi:excisionase family DNA binding protein
LKRAVRGVDAAQFGPRRLSLVDEVVQPEQRVARYITEGRLPARRLPGGQFRVRREDVLKLLREVEDEFGADAT